MAGLLSLPEDILELIAAKTAKRLSWYQENWGGAAASCKCLHNVQLPGESVVVEGIQSERFVLYGICSAVANNGLGCFSGVISCL